MTPVAALVAACTILALASRAAAGFYSFKQDGVVELTPQTAEKYLRRTENAVLAEFYAPWCGHCQSLKPAYKTAAAKLRGLASVVAVNCDDEANKPLCGQHQIRGFPTLKLFKTVYAPGSGSGSGLGSTKARKFSKLAVDYDGPRTVRGLVDATLAIMPSHSTVLDKNTAGEWLANDTLVACNRTVLLSTKKTTPPLWKALSTRLRGLCFAEIRPPTSTSLESVFGAGKLPAVIVLPAGVTAADAATHGKFYDGDLKLAPLEAFLRGFLPNSGSEGSSPPAPPAAPIPKNATEIASQAEFDSACLERPGVCVVAFLTLEAEFPESVEAFEHARAALDAVQTAEAALGHSHALFHVHYVNVLRHGRQLARDLQLTDAYPTAVAIQPHRQRFLPLRGGFSEQSLLAWFADIRAGRQSAFGYSQKLVLDSRVSAGSDEL